MSSNGRTRDFGSRYGGSNPPVPATLSNIIQPNVKLFVFYIPVAMKLQEGKDGLSLRGYGPYPQYVVSIL